MWPLKDEQQPADQSEQQGEDINSGQNEQVSMALVRGQVKVLQIQEIQWGWAPWWEQDSLRWGRDSRSRAESEGSASHSDCHPKATKGDWFKNQNYRGIKFYWVTPLLSERLREQILRQSRYSTLPLPKSSHLLLCRASLVLSNWALLSLLL